MKIYSVKKTSQKKKLNIIKSKKLTNTDNHS